MSYLSQSEQAAVVEAMENHDTKPSLSQAKRLKKMKQEGKLTIEQIHKMLGEIKKSSKGEPTGSARFRKYFPADYSPKQIEQEIIAMLKERQTKQKLDSKTSATAV